MSHKIELPVTDLTIDDIAVTDEKGNVVEIKNDNHVAFYELVEESGKYVIDPPDITSGKITLCKSNKPEYKSTTTKI